MKLTPLFCLVAGFVVAGLHAADDALKTNIDETQVPAYTLPDPLLCKDGTHVTDAETWRAKRRPEILELFRSQIYGRSPAPLAPLRFFEGERDATAFDGLATRREVTLYLTPQDDEPAIHLLIYTPNAVKEKAPVFLSMNFDGNHTVSKDPKITIWPQWQFDNKTKTEARAKPDEKTRGSSASRWALETILKRGYAIATFTRADIEPDFATGWKHGIRGWVLKHSGKDNFAPDDWGCIGAWAWGMSRALDFLAYDSAFDAQRVAVVGHSRLGKATLWAGAQDERFAIVISNDSGEGGAALARRWFGETTAVMNAHFPHWLCGNAKQYGGHEDRMPTDQHELIALMAPRPVYVASAEEDKWSDPRGEFLSAKHAEPVYKLFEKAGLTVDEWPAVNHPVGETIGYHIRTGKHDVTDFDWEQYLNFADKHFKK